MLKIIPEMLRDMYKELYPDTAVDDLHLYTIEYLSCRANDKISIHSNSKGFFMVKDVTDPLTPSLKRYDGFRVYIRPEHRSGKVLREFYDKLFELYPDGDILGLTLVQSNHIEVLNKRHKHIANLYVLDRSK